MSLRTLVILTILAGLVALLGLPSAAAGSCPVSSGAGSFSLSCSVGGTCASDSPCVLEITCNASYIGIATPGDCASNPMACGATGCTGFRIVSVASGSVWSFPCSVSGTTLTTASLSCTYSNIG
jgi:hypothetical protein